MNKQKWTYFEMYFYSFFGYMLHEIANWNSVGKERGKWLKQQIAKLFPDYLNKTKHFFQSVQINPYLF